MSKFLTCLIVKIKLKFSTSEEIDSRKLALYRFHSPQAMQSLPYRPTKI